MAKLQRAAPYVLLFGFSLFCLWSLSSITAGAADGQLGPAFWPRLILSFMALLCVYEALKRLAGAKDQFSGFIERQERAAERGDEVGSVSTLMATSVQQEEESANPLQMGKLLGGIALIALYAIGIDAIGFFCEQRSVPVTVCGHWRLSACALESGGEPDRQLWFLFYFYEGGVHLAAPRAGPI